MTPQKKYKFLERISKNQVGRVIRGQTAAYRWLNEHAKQVQADGGDLLVTIEVYEGGPDRWELFERLQLEDLLPHPTTRGAAE